MLSSVGSIPTSQPKGSVGVSPIKTEVPFEFLKIERDENDLNSDLLPMTESIVTELDSLTHPSQPIMSVILSEKGK